MKTQVKQKTNGRSSSTSKKRAEDTDKAKRMEILRTDAEELEAKAFEARQQIELLERSPAKASAKPSAATAKKRKEKIAEAKYREQAQLEIQAIQSKLTETEQEVERQRNMLLSISTVIKSLALGNPLGLQTLLFDAKGAYGYKTNIIKTLSGGRPLSKHSYKVFNNVLENLVEKYDVFVDETNHYPMYPASMLEYIYETLEMTGQLSFSKK